MAPQPDHTYGPKCRLAPVSRFTNDDGMPPIEAQFFYSSPIPIDDPLSTGSGSGSDARTPRGQLRPFGRGDNNALEKAWLGLASDDDRRDHDNAWNGTVHDAPNTETESDKRMMLVQALASRHWDKHGSGFQPQDMAMPVDPALPSTPAPPCCAELFVDVSEELQQSFCALARKVDPRLTTDSVVQEVIAATTHLRQSSNTTSKPLQSFQQSQVHANDGARPSSRGSMSTRRRGTSVTEAKPAPSPRLARPSNDSMADTDKKSESRPRAISTSQTTNRSSRTQTPVGSPSVRPPPPDDGISGTPFVRVGSADTQQPMPPPSIPNTDGAPAADRLPRDVNKDLVETLEDSDLPFAKEAETAKEAKYGKESIEVAVGVSRLHMVSLPVLQMKPIYWSPVNDVAVVTRATWFYRDTMLPVLPAVANQLEAGYHELRPWTETWRDEIRCAIDVGPPGEEKVSHKLWPKNPNPSHHERGLHDPLISSDPFCAARCFKGEAAAEGCIEPLQAPKTEPGNRAFSNYHVFYKDHSEAFLLKPSLKPSAYYGRRPVQKLMKGVTIGVPVVRGFDRQVWDRIHHRKQPPNQPGVSAASDLHESTGREACKACKAEKDRGQVTDLVLVAHGIGQKFAERVESFHFTHAINAFRRAVNIELGGPVVQQVLRKDQNGLMILPLNWRMGLSFEDGGPMREEDKYEHTPDGFGLKDIEPSTIPAIRSMISDVMFDIPFYMSHHKGKMIQALVAEANRVYRLWCHNNPGFAENGRVHLIGHSLGSAMALEVLSRQPTTVPRLDLSRSEPHTSFFEFDTKNLFLVGSPAGFFLLLERGTLIPRRGRRKPGADPADAMSGDVAGDAGAFGCLAVDNIYNILAKEDPIAYLLNGAVDSAYAASLKTAYVPSATTSLLKSVGDAFRTAIPGMAPPTDPFAPSTDADHDAHRPPTARLPSQLELEVHDFTREELAEKKALLLNDNGQIDYFLRSGGGPLEIQYLNMLSAHTSYWTNQDFIRMLCVEVGRKPGKKSTLPAMRAVKATKRMFK